MIQIDQLQIRLPGNNEEEGNLLGEEVANKLSQRIPEYSGNHHISELRLQLKDIVSRDTSQLAELIADRIIQEIKLKIY